MTLEELVMALEMGSQSDIARPYTLIDVNLVARLQGSYTLQEKLLYVFTFF